MIVIDSPLQFNVEDLYVDLRRIMPGRLFLKCEGFNFAGSVKLKAAVLMVAAGEDSGALAPGATIMESSSGNMGVALSVAAAAKGFNFVCVTDARSTLKCRQLMRAFGAQVHVITDASGLGGFLGARLRRVAELRAANPDYVWLNQYANRHNWLAHYQSTAPAIAHHFPDLEVLFVGAGTTGTLMGCARYFRETRPSVTIVAVDSEGSVTFGGASAPRRIPGLGTSVRPQLLDESCIDAVVHVPEEEAIRTCHQLARHGYLFGGSTGTVLSGAQQWLRQYRPDEDPLAVAISPDLGERYLDTVYDKNWLLETYGPQVLGDLAPVSLVM
jgi:2,3-diaminopropionate biosynthesis protein SbnA